MAAFIVLLGPPGVGKGTQARIVAETTGLPHISSGDLFRENMKNQTPLGIQVREYMEKGELVPDDLTIAMVRERIGRPDCASGAILDGFPRTPAQASALEDTLAAHGANVTAVPFLSGDVNSLSERIGGRLTCRAEGHIYHLRFSPPKVSGRCDFDGSELFQRSDDTTETVQNRIRVYMEQTAPLVEHYRAEGKLVEIDGMRPIEQVTAAIVAAIGT